jgi:tetratricopeptide (TPR) repeat protein
VHAGGGSSRVVLSIFRSYRFHFYREVDRLNSLSLPRRIGLPWLSAFCLLLGMCVDSGAQTSRAGGQELLHGSIFSSQGQPAAEAAVELRDLSGIKVASAVTDGSGNFQINSPAAAAPGEYVFLASSGYQIRYEQVLLAQPGLELSLALPAAAVRATPAAGRYTVSAKQLGVTAKARERLVAAQESFRKLKFDEAEQEIDGALRADSAFAAAFAMRAFIRLAQKDVHRAVEDARHAVLLDAEDAESFVALATSYNSLREFEKAEDAAWHALSLRPDCWQGRLELAKTLYGQGRFVVALREMDELHQDFPDVHLVRANVLARLNRAQEAAEEFERFLQQAPDDPRSERVKRIVAQVAAPTPSPSTQH